MWKMSPKTEVTNWKLGGYGTVWLSLESALIHRIIWKLAQNILEIWLPIWIKQSYLVKLRLHGIMVEICEKQKQRQY